MMAQRREYAKNNIRDIFYKNGIYIILFVLAGFMHLYRLGDIPQGLHIDEAGMAYDAFCLANYSTDRYLNHLPVYLINFGGGQSALYAYLVAILFKLGFGLNAWTIRMPGAVLALIAYVAGVSIIRKIMGEKWGVISAFLMAILPYFTMQSRFGLDCNLLLSMSIISFWMLLKAYEKKKTICYILAGILWGISYYTYALGYISITVFLGLILLYWLYLKKIRWKEIVMVLLPAAIIASPLLLMVMINLFDLPQMEIAGVTIPKLPTFRNSSLNVENIWVNLKATITAVLTRDQVESNALDKYYTMYKVSIPFVVIGFVYLLGRTFCSLVKKEYHPECLLCIWVITYLFLGSLIGRIDADRATINRVNGIFFGLLFCLVYGMRYAYRRFGSWLQSDAEVKKDSVRECLRLIPHCRKKAAYLLLLFYCVCFIGFARYYFTKMPRFTDFRELYPDILEFIETSTGEPKVVYTSTPYIYYLLSARVSPYDVDLKNDPMATYWKFVFHLPDPVGEDGEDYIFIVNGDNAEYLDKLRTYYSFDEYKSGMYYCFYKK